MLLDSVGDVAIGLSFLKETVVPGWARTPQPELCGHRGRLAGAGSEQAACETMLFQAAP